MTRKKILLIFLGLMIGVSIAFAAPLRVITQEAAIRKDRRFFAPVVARVRYGEALQELQRRGDWLRVSYRGKEGWIHISAVQEQKFRLSGIAGERARESSAEEVALAGKGFTPEVEKSYREKNPQARYDLVDKVLAYEVGDAQVESFIRSGNLKEPGGAS